jgi:N-acyl-L-homoserine lactone synthetase
MVLVLERLRHPLHDHVLKSMFEARKRVFVDLLRWEVPVLEDRFEFDQFDDEHAVYLVLSDTRGHHLASARLLQTMRPHILDTLFPELCADRPPRGAGIYEITRFCLDPRQDARQRLESRNRLVSALVDFALERGIHAYTGVAEMGWFQQILAFGWRCAPLGLPRSCNGKTLAALRIEIADNTPALLAWNNIYRPLALSGPAELEEA